MYSAYYASTVENEDELYRSVGEEGDEIEWD